MKRLAVFALILAPLTFAFGERKPQSLSFSGFAVKPGDNQQEVLNTFQAHFKFVKKVSKAPLPGTEDYLVQKDDDDLVGVLTFKDGTLSKAYHDWTPTKETPYALAKAIQGAVDAVQDERPCELHTGHVRTRGYSYESSMIVCGSKYIEISGVESSQKRTVSVYEWIDDGRSKP